MAQQIQFIYLTQSEYDALDPKSVGKIYFTSDTHRIYKGPDLYAATTFDQLNFSAITASSIMVDGQAVALSGHTHPASDITGLEAAISGFASAGHTHSELSGITDTSISKANASFNTLSASAGTFGSMSVSGNVSASVGTFYDINVTGTATFSATDIAATSVTVNGSAVSLEGHGHSVADIDGLETTLSGYASSGHTHAELSGIASDSISKSTASFGSVSASSATFGSVSASDISLTGDITASVGTFHDINVNGTATFSAANAVFTNLSVSTATFDVEIIDTQSINVVDLTASNLNITNTVSIVGASVSTLSTENLYVSGSLLYNNKEVATQEYVQQMISVAIGQALASEY